MDHWAISFSRKRQEKGNQGSIWRILFTPLCFQQRTEDLAR